MNFEIIQPWISIIRGILFGTLIGSLIFGVLYLEAKRKEKFEKEIKDIQTEISLMVNGIKLSIDEKLAKLEKLSEKKKRI